MRLHSLYQFVARRLPYRVLVFRSTCAADPWAERYDGREVETLRYYTRIPIAWFTEESGGEALEVREDELRREWRWSPWRGR